MLFRPQSIVDGVLLLSYNFCFYSTDLDEIRPILPQLLDGKNYFIQHCYGRWFGHRLMFFFFAEFFKLMGEVENEDLVFTLETIVDRFGEEMAPYALGLCQSLVCCRLICIQLTVVLCCTESTSLKLHVY